METNTTRGYFNIKLQTTCNAKEEFTSIDAQGPGSVHDSRILNNSAIYAQMNNMRHNNMLLGDSGYGFSCCLMTPYRNPETRKEITFNTLFTKERDITERCLERSPVLQYMVIIIYKKTKRCNPDSDTPGCCYVTQRLLFTP
nr:unnamed protein product [Callosobruchus analis]